MINIESGKGSEKVVLPGSPAADREIILASLPMRIPAPPEDRHVVTYQDFSLLFSPEVRQQVAHNVALVAEHAGVPLDYLLISGFSAESSAFDPNVDTRKLAPAKNRRTYE